MTDQTNRPLWQVMQLEHHRSLPPQGEAWEARHGYAADRAEAGE
jgi:hypothetical protein